MKMTPKSCGCRSCRRGKSTKSGKEVLKNSERAYRHKTKIALHKGLEDVVSVPYSGYTD